MVRLLGLIGTVWAGASLLVAGCDPQRTQAQAGQKVEAIESLQPGASPGDEAILLLGGVRIPVKVARKEEDGRIMILLEAHGQVIDEEYYLQTAEGFLLVRAGEETYDPPVPLLRPQMRTDETWQWSGSMTAGQARPASAKVTNSVETLFVGGESLPAVRVDVGLEFESGGPAPAVRTLSFWFAKDRGLLKREFGSHSSRVPPGTEE
jgi:hypothetical protein